MLFKKTKNAIVLRGLLTFLLSMVLFSNEGFCSNGKPDFQKIMKEVTDVNSPNYLEKLVNRFLNYDLTLNSDELQHLYYGYKLAKKEYNPISYSEKAKALQMMNSIKNNYAAAAEKCNSFLEKDMFDMDFYHYKGLFEYEKNHDFAASDKVFKFYYNLFRAIRTSGNGMSKESSIYIININHISFIAKLMGFQIEGNIKEKGSLLEVPLKKNDLGVDVIYFNLVSESVIEKETIIPDSVKIHDEPQQMESSSAEAPARTNRNSFMGTSSFVGSYRAASTNTNHQVVETTKETTNNNETISQIKETGSQHQPVLSDREKIIAERKAERERLMAERMAERERLIAERMAQRERLITERKQQAKEVKP